MAFRGIQDRLSMKGKVAVVSGAGRGIGKAVALALAEVGAAVVFAEMDEQTGPATQQAIEDAGCEALWVHADVRHGDQVNRLMNAAVERFGSVDTMVNNAGGVFFSPALDISEHGFDALIRQNLKTMWLCSQAAAKRMVAQGTGGSIVSIASMAAFIAAVNHAPYGAAKAGVIGLTKALAVEWAPHKIRVNAVAPGGVDTAGRPHGPFGGHRPDCAGAATRTPSPARRDRQRGDLSRLRPRLLCHRRDAAGGRRGRHRGAASDQDRLRYGRSGWKRAGIVSPGRHAEKSPRDDSW